MMRLLELLCAAGAASALRLPCRPPVPTPLAPSAPTQRTSAANIATQQMSAAALVTCVLLLNAPAFAGQPTIANAAAQNGPAASASAPRFQKDQTPTTPAATPDSFLSRVFTGEAESPVAAS